MDGWVDIVVEEAVAMPRGQPANDADVVDVSGVQLGFCGGCDLGQDMVEGPRSGLQSLWACGAEGDDAASQATWLRCEGPPNVDCHDPREKLLRSAFDRLDAAGAGFVNCSQMLRWGRFMGFAGPVDQWKPEYLSLCRYLGRDPHLGVDFVSFCRLLEDRSNGGTFATDIDLQKFLKSNGLFVPSE